MILWLVAGVLLFVGEVTLPAVGFLFASFGALTVGMLLNLGVVSVDDTLLQILIFLASTALWTLILWKHLQKSRSGKNRAAYSNIVGETAKVADNGISRIGGGEVVWSGAIMKAKLADNVNIERLEAGTMVTIKEINGNVLTVNPK